MVREGSVALRAASGQDKRKLGQRYLENLAISRVTVTEAGKAFKKTDR